MKILHVTDLHGELPWYQWLAREAHKYDLVCLSGDLIHLDDTAPRQITEVTRVLREIRTPLAICSGNHDTVHAQSSGQGSYWVRAYPNNPAWPATMVAQARWSMAS